MALNKIIGTQCDDDLAGTVLRDLIIGRGGKRWFASREGSPIQYLGQKVPMWRCWQAALAMMMTAATVPIANVSQAHEQADAFVPRCWLPAMGATVRDPEFDEATLWATWQQNLVLRPNGTVRRHGRVYLAPVDAATGNILMEQQRVFKDARPVTQQWVGNGPEWGRSARGSEVFYTAYTAAERIGRIGKISLYQAGDWQLSYLLESDLKTTPSASRTETDGAPLIHYIEREGVPPYRHGWRRDVVAFADTSFPNGYSGGSWIPGTQTLVHSRAVGSGSDSPWEIAIYDTATGISTPILTVSEQPLFPFRTWEAPETGGPAFLYRPARGTEIQVFRQQSGTTWSLWTELASIDPAYPLINSPEPFVFANRSYVTMALYQTGATQANPSPSLIGVSSVNPALPPSEVVRRIISTEFSTTGVSVKNDPEPLPIPQSDQALVYYNDGGVEGGSAAGLVACDTGL
jgi:hypothetical protein